MSKSNQLKAALLLEMVALLKTEGTPIKFANELIVVADPEIEIEDGNYVHADGVAVREDGTVLAVGGVYDNGVFITEADPVDANLLSCEELENLLEATKRAVKG